MIEILVITLEREAVEKNNISPRKNLQNLSPSMKTVKLTSSDQQEFTVEEKIIFQSALIKNMMADLEVGDASIPLPNVTGHILAKGIID
jgi:hypothetical protein